MYLGPMASERVLQQLQETVGLQGMCSTCQEASLPCHLLPGDRKRSRHSFQTGQAILTVLEGRDQPGCQVLWATACVGRARSGGQFRLRASRHRFIAEAAPSPGEHLGLWFLFVCAHRGASEPESCHEDKEKMSEPEAEVAEVAEGAQGARLVKWLARLGRLRPVWPETSPLDQGLA